MSHVPIETTEEDAADLQFPKGKYIQMGNYELNFHSIF